MRLPPPDWMWYTISTQDREVGAAVLRIVLHNVSETSPPSRLAGIHITRCHVSCRRGETVLYWHTWWDQNAVSGEAMTEARNSSGSLATHFFGDSLVLALDVVALVSCVLGLAPEGPVNG